MISARTRGALAAAKVRGKSLGGFRGRAGSCTDLEKARAVRVANAKQRATDLAPTIRALQAEGANSLRSIAAGLNARRITCPWRIRKSSRKRLLAMCCTAARF